MRFVKRPRRSSLAWPFLFCAPILALFFATTRTPRAQQAPAPPPAIQSASDLVVLDVSVLDKTGNFYSGLGQSDFRILDNGVEKQAAFFAPVEAPAHVAILVETGPAVFLIHDQHLLALSTLLNGLAPDDQAALFSYQQSAREIVPFTADKAALGTSIGEEQFMLGMDQLNFFDSLRSVIDALPAGPEKKSIVVLTTGLDSSPADQWDLLVEKLRADNVVIFPVGLGGSLRGDAPTPATKKSKKKGAAPATSHASNGPTAFARADQALRTLAQITGGKAYFPQTPNDFALAYREIAAALRNQYELGIAPDHDGTFHKISIEVQDNRARKSKSKTPEYRALYREGYLAPAQ